MTGALSPAAGHALMALAAAALGAAALRAASRLAPRGLERMLAAAPIAVSVACLQALALGLVGLGSSPLVLSLAAFATCAAALRWLPRPAVSVRADLGHWWARRSIGERAALGAGGGLLVATAAWMLEHPFLGEDAVSYRLPTVIAWIDSGAPGSLYNASEDYATGAYPLGNELVLAWPMAIARSFVAASLWTPLALALACVAGWHGLRSLGVPRAVAVLALLAVCLLPVQLSHLNEPNSDTPALAWTVCAAALCTGAARRPALLAPALLAGGLALGAKTTAAVPLALALALGLWSARGELHRVRGVLSLAAAAAAVLGGLWYARNLVLHGSPLWPFRDVPWGDPSPPLLEALDHSLLERPRATLAGNRELYAFVLAGGLVLGAGALLAPLADRSRAVLAAAGAAGLALLAYAAAPVTGIGDAGLTGFPLFTLRYLLPALAVCALTIALLARGGARRAALASTVLAVSAAWSLVRDLEQPFPLVPSPFALVTGALGGALLAVALAPGALARLRRALRPGAAPGARLQRTTRRPGPADARAAGAPARLPGSVARALALACAAAGVGLGLSLPAAGYVERAAEPDNAPLVAVPRFFTSPAAPPESEPVFFAPIPDARVAGDGLRRPLRRLATDVPCQSLRRRGWVVLTTSSAVLNNLSDLELPPGPLERCAFADPPVVGAPAVLAIYPPRAAARAMQRPFPAR
jgi:hypothetical protein